MFIPIIFINSEEENLGKEEPWAPKYCAATVLLQAYSVSLLES